MKSEIEFENLVKHFCGGVGGAAEKFIVFIFLLPNIVQFDVGFVITVCSASQPGSFGFRFATRERRVRSGLDWGELGRKTRT